MCGLCSNQPHRERPVENVTKQQTLENRLALSIISVLLCHWIWRSRPYFLCGRWRPGGVVATGVCLDSVPPHWEWFWRLWLKGRWVTCDFFFFFFFYHRLTSSVYIWIRLFVDFRRGRLEMRNFFYFSAINITVVLFLYFFQVKFTFSLCSRLLSLT